MRILVAGASGQHRDQRSDSAYHSSRVCVWPFPRWSDSIGVKGAKHSFPRPPREIYSKVMSSPRYHLPECSFEWRMRVFQWTLLPI